MRHSFHSARILRYMRKPLISIVTTGAMLFFYPMYAFTAPTNGLVVKGSATIDQIGTTTTIDQGSARAVIDWGGFGINTNELVKFNQPNSSAVVLNRVTGGDPSNILGQLSANGRVFITNPNGILFGATAKVDVAGLTATTLSISNDNFMNGKYLFTQDLSKANSYVVNQGEIHIADNGFCFLVAPGVSNQGTIVAQLGKVVMASGKELTLDFNGDGLMTYTVSGKVLETVIGPDGQPMSSGVANSGTITAKGGEVVLVGNAGGNVFSSVVNNSGVIEATALGEEGGTVILSGGDEGITQNSGSIDVSGKLAGQKGGTVEVLGEKVGLFDGTRIDASGNAGGGTVLVGGDYQGKNADVQNASRTFVGSDAQIKADAIGNGDGGKVIVWSNDGTQFYGNISARGGQLGGNGGFAEVSGKAYLDYNGFTDLSAPQGTVGKLLLDPSNITISTAADSNISGATPFTPAGAVSILNTGTLTTALAGSDVTVQTGGGGDGVITVADIISWSSSHGLTIGSASDIIVNAAITNGGTGQIYLGAGGAVTLNASLSTAGNIRLTAAGAGSITQSAGTLTGVNIELSSNNGIGSLANPINTTSTGTLTLSSAGAGSAGDIFVTESNALNTNRVSLSTLNSGQSVTINDTAAGNAIITGGNIGLSNVNITLNATVGKILEGVNTVTGNAVKLTSATGVGSDTSNRVKTAAATLEASSSTSGGVYVNETDGVALGGTNSAAANSYDLTAGGAITVSGSVNTGGASDTVLNAGGDITLSAAVGNISNNTTLTTTGNILQNGGTRVAGNSVSLTA
ncbi:MAG TPA: filamentous hemagglutinin N-terminal domain-containing protein, partial [Chlorobaculum sp.]|nr:filamentous hemagglutinin N-terminal domain-containing protein [Chlorobaculum sp.]